MRPNPRPVPPSHRHLCPLFVLLHHEKRLHGGYSARIEYLPESTGTRASRLVRRAHGFWRERWFHITQINCLSDGTRNDGGVS